MKLRLHALGCISEDQTRRNIASAKQRGLPFIREARLHSKPLAVVGGGPSIKGHVDTLAQWAGDVWAINGAHDWCLDHGIDAVFFTIDPLPVIAEFARRAKRAIVSTACDPATFVALSDANVRLLEIWPHGWLRTGSTTATAVPMLSPRMGYREVTFFGCESSFGEQSHAYFDRPSNEIMKVTCGGQEFLSEAEYVLQAEILAPVIRECPQVFKEQSGGFLSALVKHGDYDVLAVSRRIFDAMRAS